MVANLWIRVLHPRQQHLGSSGVICQVLCTLAKPCTLELMCKSSVYSLFLSLNVTGILPKGCIVAPFATFGMMLDGKRLLIFSFRSLRMPLPAAEISAPESGRALVRVEPLEEVMLTLTLGAGSVEVT